MKLETLNGALERARTVPETGLRLLDRRERPTFLEWSEIHRRASEVCAGLQRLGVERGERVALIFPTSEDFFSAFFGTLLAGAVPTPLYPPVRLGRLTEYHHRTARMIEVSSSRVVLTDKRIRRLLGEAIAEAKPRFGCLILPELTEGVAAADAHIVDVEPDELGLVQFSSGTTVEPKPVALSHGAILEQVYAIGTFWPPDDGIAHCGVSWLPLYHDMGLIGCVFPALERPAVLTLMGPEVFLARPAMWLRAMSKYRGTLSTAPNFAYGLCVQRIKDEDIEGIDLSEWRIALCGAEAVAPAVLRAFKDRFARYGLRESALSPVYGLAEAALAVTFSDLWTPFETKRFDGDALATERIAVPKEDGREMVSVGTPIPGFDVRIRDDEWQDLPENTIGRVHVRGPSLMSGYLDQPELTAKSMRDGWLDTGDLGFLHAGELYLTGRAKDILIIRGRNHAPEEIEHPVDPVPGVRVGCAAAASWMPEGADREIVVLFVEKAQDATPEQVAAMPEGCNRAVLAAANVELDEVVVLDPGTLPRTSSGKIRRAETVRQFLAGELAPPDRVTVLRMIGAMGKSMRAMARYQRSIPDERI